MTLSSNASRIDYAGNGSTTVFAFPYYFLAEVDLIVVRRDALTGAETVLALGTDYTVAGAGASTGGTVTLSIPPATGQTLTIRRRIALVQETDFVANDPLSAEVLERAIDRVVMALQQQEEVQARTLQFPVGDSTSLSTILPSSNIRASRSFGFNAAGEPIAVDPPVVSSSDLVVVASTAPGHQSGRLWIDTGTANTLIVKQSDGADWTELWRVDTAANAFSHQSDITVGSVDAGPEEGPILTLDRASVSPVASDQLGVLAFQGRSTTGVARGYARLLAGILDPTNASEDGRLQLQTAIAGSLATRVTLADRLLLAVALETAKGASVASAATTDIWGPGDGTLLHVTGTTTITSFGTAPQAGALRVLIFDAGLTLTHGANLVLNNNGANITVAAGDLAIAIADSTIKHYCYLIRASGLQGVRQVKHGIITATSGTTQIPGDNTTPEATEGTEIWSRTIALQDPANAVRVRCSPRVSNSANGTVTLALFRDSLCIGSATMDVDGAGEGNSMAFETYDSPEDTNQHTYSCRLGTNNGTWYVGALPSAIHNGELAKQHYTLEEVAVAS